MLLLETADFLFVFFLGDLVSTGPAALSPGLLGVRAGDEPAPLQHSETSPAESQRLMNESQLLARGAETRGEIGEGFGEEGGEQRSAGGCGMARQELG